MRNLVVALVDVGLVQDDTRVSHFAVVIAKENVGSLDADLDRLTGQGSLE